MSNRILAALNRKSIGCALLIIALGIGFFTLNKGQFGDEADNLVVGALIVKGHTLYRDIFSHHFPFPYYWMASVVLLFGKSIFIARLSILAFQTIAFALGARLSGNYLLLGITAIIWSVVRPFYLGNMVLYNTFAGIALFVILIATLALLQRHPLPVSRYWLAIGIFSLVAFLSDPLSIYAIGIAMIVLFTKKPSWAIKTSLIFGGGLSLYVGYLVATGNLQAFWNDAILFNSQVYAKYVYTNPLRIKQLLDMAIHGLNISDRAWLNFDPFRPVPIGFTEFDRWFFTGFLYRFSVIAAALFLALRKRFRAAILLYLFAAAALVIYPWDFRGLPFIMISLVGIAALIANDWWLDTNSNSLKIAQIGVGAGVLVVVGWLCLWLALDIYHNRSVYAQDQFAPFEQNSSYIQQLTCGQPNVLLAHYPAGSYYYWFTDLQPVSKYVFMWPWVAEVGLNDVIQELSQKQTLALVVIQPGVIWERYDTKEYLQPLEMFVEAHYLEVADGIYMSPELQLRCSN